MAKDFLGEPLAIGDRVVLMVKSYRYFQIGNIISMADKTCVVKLGKPTGRPASSEFRQFYSQLIKIPLRT